MTELLLAMAILLLAMSLAAWLPVAHGLLRICDFPRQQIATLAVAVALGSVIFVPWPTEAWILALLTGVLLVQGFFILRFTPVWRAQSKRFDPASECGAPIRVLTANVKQSNRDAELLEGLVAQHDPGLVALMEVDARWMRDLADMLSGFDHVIAQPQENSYGMVVASHYPLDDVAVRDLLTEGVPSITCTVRLQTDMPFRLYCVHPEPPIPNADTVGRDAEISIVAKLAREEKLPVIVAGDLNDVGWSRTTRRFQRISRLLDPRVGRGMFNTFDARFFFMRWPLDHLFHSAAFRLAAMARLPFIGSDHFPMLFDLVLTGDPRASAPVESMRGEDLERADELIDKADARDAGPIGTDWETS